MNLNLGKLHVSILTALNGFCFYIKDTIKLTGLVVERTIRYVIYSLLNSALAEGILKHTSSLVN